MLRDLGCEIRLADNGREALNALRSQAFDIVFMDCQMPEMDGFEAVRRFRSAAQADFETRLDAPIVALTANALAGDQERCLAAGFDEYLPKPFKQHQIEALLVRWTRRSATGNDVRAYRSRRQRRRQTRPPRSLPTKLRSSTCRLSGAFARWNSAVRHACSSG